MGVSPHLGEIKMMSRREIRKKRKRSIMRKFLAGTLFLILIVGSGIHVSFADEDISALLSKWFHKNTEDSMEEIDKAISIEQQKQTERLKEELRIEIVTAEKQLQEFIDTEKANRIEALKRYADGLISNSQINNEESKEEVIEELERIYQEAKTELSEVEF